MDVILLNFRIPDGIVSDAFVNFGLKIKKMTSSHKEIVSPLPFNMISSFFFKGYFGLNIEYEQI
jgi:hypothetical protein